MSVDRGPVNEISRPAGIVARLATGEVNGH